MQNTVSPIKRSEQLAPLSREHHDGLLFCWKIRQGLGNGTPVSTLQEFVLWYWRSHLQHHFKQEESILLPYIGGHPFAEQLLKEHQDIRDVILSLERNPDVNLFSVLASFVNNHIRFEERHLFNYLEKILSLEELDLVAGKLAALHENADDSWTIEFWIRKNKK